MSEERLKLEDIITSGTGKALIDEIKYNELMQLRVEKLLKQNRELKDIIKEVREYIEQYGNLYCLKHTQFKNYHQYKVILEILDKVEKENDIEFDVLKALNTDLDDDVKMG